MLRPLTVLPPAVTTILMITLFLFIAATCADAQELRPYKHPGLDLQFTADCGWQQLPRPGDEQTHERVDPETGIHVLMWSSSTEQSADRYLAKMSGMMDFAPDTTPQPRTIAGFTASVCGGPGTIDETAASMLLAVIPIGASEQRPAEEILYIVQIWCPQTSGPQLANRMDELLASVRITNRLVLPDSVYRLYPVTTEIPVELPSPFVTDAGETYVTVGTQDGRYGLVRVTVENGAPNAYDRGEWDKGRQLAVDADDFPTLARTGLHAAAELNRTATITGLPVADITVAARPRQASRSGFVATDEDILAVIRGDNRLVSRLGLTHRDLARPLFEVFNLILRDLELHRRSEVGRANIVTVLYNGHEIHIEASGGKGWQESIFADEVLGYYQIRIWRRLTDPEDRYLSDHHNHLPPQQLGQLRQMLASIQTGEMIPFYIQRYGFYEGHTAYRADPIAIANLFGLMSIEQIDAALGGDLYGAFTRHHTPAGHGD